MFTGMIKEIGRVLGVTRSRNYMRYEISSSRIIDQLELGSSVALDGVCQSVTALGRKSFTVEALSGTLDKTTLAYIYPGIYLNLEPSLNLGDGMDGHMVQGHVSGQGVIKAIEKRPKDFLVRVDCSGWKGRLLKEGSIALDGISLTVYDMFSQGFVVNIIPDTWSKTTLPMKRVGQRINLEEDIQQRIIGESIEKSQMVDENKLKQWGYQ
jgi:riboflavin synthase